MDQEKKQGFESKLLNNNKGASLALEGKEAEKKAKIQWDKD